MGAYRGSFGELVECVLAHAAGDADGHGDLHSLGAPFYGGSAGGICYGDSIELSGQRSRWQEHSQESGCGPAARFCYSPTKIRLSYTLAGLAERAAFDDDRGSSAGTT